MRDTDVNGANGVSRKSTITVLLKYLNNFWRLLEIPLINCKVELKLKWSKDCILVSNGTDNINAVHYKPFLLPNTRNYMSP